MHQFKIHYKKATFLLVSMIVVLTISSCTTSNSVATWTDSEYKGGPLKKIVVIGVFKNLSSRKEFEEKIAKKISDNSGVEAVPSLKFLTPGVKYEHKAMEKIFSEKGFDGILIVRTKSVDNLTSYVPGKNHLVRNVQKINTPASYHNYYLVTWKSIREPAYFEEAYIVSTESSLFLNSNDKMIWTMEKRTEQNYRVEDGITHPKAESLAIAGLIFKSLKTEKLLIPEGK